MPNELQHYVSQFYLKNFGALLHCLNKETCKVFTTTPEKICAENKFYNESDTNEDSFERYLSKKESRFAPIVRELIERPDLTRLSKTKKELLADFVAIQFLRTREDRESIRNMGEKMIRLTIPEEERQSYEKMFDEEYVRDFHVSFIQDFSRTARDILLSMKWITVLNRTRMTFWTSDNPITLHNELGESPLGNLGLLNRGIALRFPLTSKIALYILDRKTFGHIPSVRLIKDEESVIFDNALQVRSSTRLLVSTDNNFDLARKVLHDHPELTQPRRKRGYAYVIRDGKMVIVDSS